MVWVHYYDREGSEAGFLSLRCAPPTCHRDISTQSEQKHIRPWFFRLLCRKMIMHIYCTSEKYFMILFDDVTWHWSSQYKRVLSTCHFLPRLEAYAGCQNDLEWLFQKRKRLFRLGRMLFNLSWSNLLACFHGCSQCVCVQFVSYLSTRSTRGIVSHHTQARTKTNLLSRKGNAKGEHIGCRIVVGEVRIST